MRFKVRCLRRRGQRIEGHLIANIPAIAGELRTHYVDYNGIRYFVAYLADPNKPAVGALLELFEPVLFNLAPNNMALRGFEAGGFVQEWILEVIS